MKLVFSEQRTYVGKTYFVGEHEVDDELAAQLLERFGRVVKKWRKPRKKRKAAAKQKPADKPASKHDSIPRIDVDYQIKPPGKIKPATKPAEPTFAAIDLTTTTKKRMGGK